MERTMRQGRPDGKNGVGAVHSGVSAERRHSYLPGSAAGEGVASRASTWILQDGKNGVGGEEDGGFLPKAATGPVPFVLAFMPVFSHDLRLTALSAFCALGGLV